MLVDVELLVVVKLFVLLFRIVLDGMELMFMESFLDLFVLVSVDVMFGSVMVVFLFFMVLFMVSVFVILILLRNIFWL